MKDPRGAWVDLKLAVEEEYGEHEDLPYDTKQTLADSIYHDGFTAALGWVISKMKEAEENG